MKKTATAILLVLFLLSGLNSVFASIQAYEKNNQALFTFWFPDNWTIEVEPDGDLVHIAPPDESLYMGFWALENPDLDDLGDAVGDILQEIFVEYDINDEDELEVNGMPLAYFEGAGIDEDGTELNSSVAIFTPDGETFCTMLYLGTPEAEAQYEDVLIQIIQSLKP